MLAEAAVALVFTVIGMFDYLLVIKWGVDS
jgi:hypothetical protein